MRKILRNRLLLSAAIVGLSAVGLSACALQGKPAPSLEYSQMQPEMVYVGQYNVAPVAPYMQADIPGGFVIDPAQKLHEFLTRRYKASGVDGILNISIAHISVQHQLEQSENAVGSFLNVAKKDVYNLHAKVQVELKNYGGYETQRVDVSAKRMISMSEHLSLAERESLQVETVQALIADIDREITKTFTQQFQISGQL